MRLTRLIGRCQRREARLNWLTLPSVRKWLRRCAVAAVLIVITVLAVVALQPHSPGIRTGKPLPPGKVRPQLVNGWDTALLLAPDGSLWAWGGARFNLMSVFPQPEILPFPHRVGSDSDWSQVAAGGIMHTVGLKTDGSLWAWGWNRQGEVGQGNMTTRHYGMPTRIGTETNWTSICAGLNHSLALKNDGSLWAWGANTDGVLGTGVTNDAAVPTMIGLDREWRTIAAGRFASFAIKSNGTIWGWGNCTSGGSNDLAPKQIGFDTNWISISAGSYAILALKADGTIWGGGKNASSASAFHSCPTTNFTQIGRDGDWTEIHTASSSFFARKKNGGWWGWGLNDFRQLGLGINVAEVISPQRLPFDCEARAFAPGVGNTLVLGTDGKLWTWGYPQGVPSAARNRFEAFVYPAVRRFPALGFLIKDEIDYAPRLLWELPPDVRRRLGTGK